MKGREVFDKIPEEACRELEAIVGPEYITTDPNITMASYGFGYGHEVYWFQGVVQPPAAIVLPKTTEEVQEIVKIPISFFADKKNYNERTFKVGEETLAVGKFKFKKGDKPYIIFGATSHMIVNFILSTNFDL